MCMFCTAIPTAAALGAKFNADQLRKVESRRWPVLKITALVIGLLLIASVTYHTLTYRP